LTFQNYNISLAWGVPHMKQLAAPLIPVACVLLITGCATPQLPVSPVHIADAPRVAGAIPEPVRQSALPPPPKPSAKVETYSVTVHKVPVQSLLFALARDAGMNVDIHPAIDGTVTLNALDQTLPQLLGRISRQVDMRYEIEGSNLVVLPDAPEWRNYKVDYVNVARSTSSSVNIATQISTTGGGSAGQSSNPVGAATGAAASSGGGGSLGSGNNNSTTSVANRSDNNFWYSLEKNIRDMLRASTLGDTQQDPLAQMAAQAQSQQAAQGGQAGQNQSGQGAIAPMSAAPQPFGDNAMPFSQRSRTRNDPSIVVNPEGGLIAVRATARQHEKIQEFLDLVVNSAKRQVLIEATIIEVKLGDQYQQGINWSGLNGRLSMNQGQVGTATLPTGVLPGTTPGTSSLSAICGVTLITKPTGTVCRVDS
jgi:general secretion pathway protein D